MLVNYALRTCNGGAETLKIRFELVLEKETIDLILASFVHPAWYGTHYLCQGDPRVTVSDVDGTLTPLSRATVQLLNTYYLQHLLFSSDIDVGMELMTIERQR